MRYVKGLFAAGALFARLFAIGLVVRPAADGGIETTVLYTYVFGPFMVGSMVALYGFLIRHAVRKTPAGRAVVLYHLFGGILLGACGVADIINVVRNERLIASVANFSVFGLLGFSLVITFFFTN